MPDIQELLSNILTAVYGEEVRGSIHDAIQQCYADGKAGSTDLIARNDISVLRAQMDEFVGGASSASSEETLLWTGNAKAVNDSINIIGAIQDYDYFDIYYNDWYTSTGEPLKVERMSYDTFTNTRGFLLYAVHPSTAVNPANDTNPNALQASVIRVVRESVNTTSSDFKVYSNNNWEWTGVSTQNASATVASGTTNPIMSIRKIVGIKHLNQNLELVDIRVGVDGTRHVSAGEAVRSLEEEIGEVASKVSDLENSNVDSIAQSVNPGGNIIQKAVGSGNAAAKTEYRYETYQDLELLLKHLNDTISAETVLRIYDTYTETYLMPESNLSTLYSTKYLNEVLAKKDVVVTSDGEGNVTINFE